MQQRDLYVVYVKQYCDSVNTFSCYLLSCFEEVRGLLLIGLKLLLVLMWVFRFLLGLKRPDQHLNASQKSPESQLFSISLQIFDRLPRVWRYIPNAAAQRARELAVSGGREHKGPSLLAGWFAPHTRLCSLCGQAALMLGFSYLSLGKVNEVVALFEEVKMG